MTTAQGSYATATGTLPPEALEEAKKFEGDHHGLYMCNRIPECMGLVKSHSMEVQNDPRFFSDNVLNYRLAAFSGLGVISGLMVQNSMDHIFGMNKRMNPSELNGLFQLISFSLLNMVMFANLLSTYIGVAQPYHTIRLMTAGPTGFECAKSYYLHATVVGWRHTAIKAMLLSLPLFVASQGFRLVVKFDRGTKEDPELPSEAPTYAIIEGYVFSALMVLIGLILIWIHCQHSSIFRDRYKSLASGAVGAARDHMTAIDERTVLRHDFEPV